MDTVASPVLLRAQLRAAGYANHEVARLLRRGELVPVRRGAYVRGGLPPDPARRHRAAVLAALGAR